MAEYHNVISKTPTGEDTKLYKVGNKYYLLFYSEDIGQYAFFEYTDANGPKLGGSVEFQDDTGSFVLSLAVLDGRSLFTEDFTASAVNLGKMNQLPAGYLNQRSFDPFEIMNINAEKFIQKWGDYFTPEYDAVMDLVFQAAINGTDINRAGIQAALPEGVEFNWRLIDYTEAKITGPGALAAWEKEQEDSLQDILDSYAGNFKFDNPDVYANILQMWTEGEIVNTAILEMIVEKMFTGIKGDDEFESYYDSIKGRIYGTSNPDTLEMTNNLGDVGTDVDSYIGGQIAQNIKADKNKMQRWQKMYETTDGKNKAIEEMQAIWDAGAPEELKGSTAYTQYLYFQQAMQSTQGMNFDISHATFDEYKYLSYGDMLKQGRQQGIENGIDFTENLLSESLSSLTTKSRYEQKY